MTLANGDIPAAPGAHATLVNRIMFDWAGMAEDELAQALASLPRKIVRWIGTNHPDNRTRKRIFRHAGIRIGREAVINSGVMFIDNYEDLISIGDRASIAPNVLFIAEINPNNSRLIDVPYVAERLCRKAPISIEADVCIGAGAIILPGTTIGRAAIIGAGAVVTDNIPARTVSAGIPARPIRKLDGG